jgi:hypothetical protein
MGNVPTVQLSDKMQERLRFWLVTINFVDLLLNCLAFLCCVFSAWIFQRRRIFHINLVSIQWLAVITFLQVVLVLNVHLLGGLIVLLGIVKCIAAIVDFEVLSIPYVTPEKPFLLFIEGFRACAAYAALLGVAVSCAERFVATFYLATYERRSNLNIILPIIGATWLVSVPGVLLCFYYNFYFTSAAFLLLITVFSGIVRKCLLKI